MKSVLFKRIEGRVKYIYYAQGNGAIKYEVPAFNYLFETVIEDAYTDGTWKQNGSDSANYRNQMSVAISRFVEEAQRNNGIRSQCTDEEIAQIDNGNFPDTLTAHHDRTSGKNAKNAVMQIVRTGEHKSQPHKGGSVMANPRIRERDYVSNYSDQTRLRTYMDRAEYEALKHPHVTTTAASVVGGGLSWYVVRHRFGASKITAAIFAFTGAAASGFLTHIAINRMSENRFIGD